MDVATIQEALAGEGLQAWLLYDFKRLNPTALQVLGLEECFLTRRFFCLIPAEGSPTWLLHGIEQAPFDHLPGSRRVYRSHAELRRELGSLLDGVEEVAMEYSPGGALPTASRVDAGTVELVRSCGVEVRPSADLLQQLLAPWGEEGLASHRRAADIVTRLAQETFAWMGERLRSEQPTSEHQAQSWLLQRLREAGLTTDEGPIIAVGPNAGNPHYLPSADASAPIRRGDPVLLDVWAKEPEGVFADITWMGCCGEPTERLQQVWEIVRDARDAALARIADRVQQGLVARGVDGDRAARAVIAQAGYQDAFIHRTGHSLGPEDHWIGANIDDYETRDLRRLIPGTGFTIEPGIYLDDFGVRSEINIYMTDSGPEVTTAPQEELVRIL